MNLLKKLTIAALSFTMAATPVSARIEDGTSDLLGLLMDSGITVTLNGPNCNSGEFHGVYRFLGMKREMELCPGTEVTAIDHATVRHESFHAVQHCVNTIRGTDLSTPIEQDPEALWANAQQYLHPDTIQHVLDTYPREDWGVELEANIAERVMTAEELIVLFNKACR
jgi:hypothetical protein